jgi:hypothetical protein
MNITTNTYKAIDPKGQIHETHSNSEVGFILFGKLKSHKEWTSIAVSATLNGITDARSHFVSEWRKGAEFAIAKVVA